MSPYKSGRLGALAAAGLALFLASCAPARTEAVRPILQGLGERDLELASAALQSALERNPSETAEVWANEESGNSGSAAPLRTYRTAKGYYCRKFRVSVFSVNNGHASAQGNACRDQDAVWKSIRQ